jgi:hypothetical protein
MSALWEGLVGLSMQQNTSLPKLFIVFILNLVSRIDNKTYGPSSILVRVGSLHPHNIPRIKRVIRDMCYTSH